MGKYGTFQLFRVTRYTSDKCHVPSSIPNLHYGKHKLAFNTISDALIHCAQYSSLEIVISQCVDSSEGKAEMATPVGQYSF